MNITYILGNGFDLQMGLKSSYTHFLSEYKKIKNGDDEDIITFKKNIDDESKRGLWSDAELALGNYTKRFSDENVDVFIKLKQNFEEELRQYLINQQKKFD